MNAWAPSSQTQTVALLPRYAGDASPHSPRTEGLSPAPVAACAAAEARWLRRAGAIVSGACVVHCAATPILCAAIPSLTGWLSQPALHWCLASLAIAAWVASVSNGRGRPQPWTIWLGGSGLAILCSGAFGPLVWDSALWATTSLGVVCSCLGGGLLLIAHLLRRTSSSACRCAVHGTATI